MNLGQLRALVAVADEGGFTRAAAALDVTQSAVSHAVANAQQLVFSPPRVGLMIAGFEVPHVHVHVFPTAGMANFDFAQADTSPDPTELDDYAIALKAALRAAGHTGVA